MSKDLVKQKIVWVDTDQALEDVCQKWHSLAMLAIDTEFMRSKTYYPMAGLIQVNDGVHNYLIDPTTISDFYPLIEVLDDTKILKVLHSCSEDLEVFQHALGCLPKNILDTQIAGALAGHGFSVGFGKMVLAVLDVNLPKSETRSDWLARPLSESQIHYAALDVEYLYALASALIKRLEALERLSWALDDSQSLLASFFENQNPDRTFLRFKSAWKLNSEQLAILKGLSRWREDMAQDKNVPRNRILKDAALFSIAQKRPDSASQLRRFEGLTDRMVRSHGEKFMAIIDQVNALSQSELPVPMPRPLSADERGVLDDLKKRVLAIAEKLNLPAEMLMRKKDYEEMLFAARTQCFKLPKSLQGWREGVVGVEILDAIKKQFSD